MTTGRQTLILQQLRQAVLGRDGAGLTDAELMAHFVGQRDGAALEALIRRHGSMVWSVCRRVLSNEQDAEDAFQASFLVFVRKASSIRAREQVGNWLYGVAYRTALKARTTTARRRAKERRAAEMSQPQAEADAGWSELLPLLDQELNRLPDKYRAAIVLCELEGRPRKEAARQLGVPEGTLSSRLATGRRMLAKRLGRPGLALSVGALATAAAVVPAPLLASTVKAVTLVAAGQATIAGVVSVRVASLAEGVVKAMLLSKLSVGAAVVAMVAVLAAGAGGATYYAAAADPKPQPQSPPVAAVSSKVNNVDKEDVKKEEPEWGEAVDGVQARLRTSKTVWNDGQTPEFALDLRNRGRRTPSGCRSVQFCELELDGKWYHYHTNMGEYKISMLPPGKQVDFWGSVSLAVPWTRKTPARKPGDPIGDKGEPLQVSAGKHTVRVAFVFESSVLPPGFGPPAGPGMRPISNPVEIEVGRESAWGEAVDGVQARLRTPRAVWKEGEAPAFSLDLRNHGKQTPHGLRIPFDCEIEMDGTWYLYGGSVNMKAADTPLEPGKQIDDWVKVSPDEKWMNKSPGPVRGPKDHLLLPPGKHTLRIAFPFSGEKPPIRPVSGPVEIEVGKESAWGAAVDGVQARLRPTRTSWDDGETPAFSLDLRNQGKHGFSLGRLPEFCEIELDGKWYVYAGRIARDRVSSSIQPGEEVDDCVAVSLAAPWVLKRAGREWGELIGAKDERLQVPTGKHTVRVAFSSDTAPLPLRPISQPVEIEVGKESAPDKPVDAVPPPTKKAAPAFVADDNNKQTAARRAVDIRKKLSETINYELAVDTTLDKALDELLTTSRGIPWTVNDAAFGPDNKDIVKRTTVEKIDPITGVTVATVLNRLLAKIPNDSGKSAPMYLIRPDRLEITTRDAYLVESYPNRNSLLPLPPYLPPLAYAVFDKVPLSEALAELANTTGGNVVVAGYAAKEAETKVTAELNGVPLDAAVTVLADMADLKCVRVGNVYYVTSRERAGLLEKEEKERWSKEEKEQAVPAKPQADKEEPKK
jgi:RNA polymerase sigma factor (sigma-70 family)